MSNDLIVQPTKQRWDRSFGGIEQLDVRHRIFLPAYHARAAQKTPRSSQLLMTMIVATVAIIFIWACVSQVEVVSTATGKIIPSGRAKVIRAKEDGVVDAILVGDGQEVIEDDVLIRLDQTETQVDLDRLTETINAEELRLARLRAMLLALDQDDWWVAARRFQAPLSATKDEVEAARRLMESALEAHVASLANYDQQLVSIDAELASSQASVEELQATTPLLRERVAALEKLAKRQATPRISWLQQKELLIQREHAIRQSHHEMDRLRAKRDSLRSSREQTAADFRSQLLGEMQATERQLADLGKDLLKARSRHRFKVLRAPIDGVVENLSVFTKGGVVEAASDLMTIVPIDADLEIEARADNRDIGFVEVGQRANIKLHAFPFERYGVVEGLVFDVANDAVRAEDGTWRYIIRIHAIDDTVSIDGREVGFFPGMTADVDILTDHRRVISFIFEPIVKTLQESLRER